MIVYNHEQYVREAIESILSQNCNFDYELIISNDASTDKTDDVIQEVLKTHPKREKIRYYNQEKNLGMMPNFLFSLKACKGDYIAMCEGDDYWIDENKLQKDVNFLENEPTYSAITSDTYYLKNNVLSETYMHTKRIWLNIGKKTEITMTDIVNRYFPHTTSWMFRNEMKYPTDFKNYIVGDMPLFILIAAKGKIKFINELRSVYRVHTSGAVGSLQKRDEIEVLKDAAYMFHSLNKYFNRKYNVIFQKGIYLLFYRELVDNPSLKKLEKSINTLKELKREEIFLLNGYKIKLLFSYIKATLLKILKKQKALLFSR